MAMSTSGATRLLPLAVLTLVWIDATMTETMAGRAKSHEALSARYLAPHHVLAPSPELPEAVESEEDAPAK